MTPTQTSNKAMTPAVPDHPALAMLPDNPTSAELADFVRLLQKAETLGGSVDISTLHHHAEGLYARSVLIPKGTFLAGLPHKAGHFNLSVGDVSVWTASTGRQRFTGMHLISSDAGDARVGFAHGDTTWVSIHRNDTGATDIKAIEDALVHGAEYLMSRRAQPAITTEDKQ